MIDIKQIRREPQRFKDAAEAKGFAVDIDKLLELDGQLLSVKRVLQETLTEKNRLGKSIPKLSGDEKQSALDKLAQLKQDEARLTRRIKQLKPEFDELMLLVPAVPDDDVPVGSAEAQNVEIKRVGKIRKFDFAPKDHLQLGRALGIIDIERAVKLAGTRNYILKGDGALLHWAVLQFAMDFMINKGYIPFVLPVLVKDEAMTGTGFYPGFEDQTYRIQTDRLNLAGTAEVPLTAYHAGEILEADVLPLKYVALSVCFRREAGAAGKDTYGVYRIHQFDKVEQVIICKNSREESEKLLGELLANAEQIMQQLELPYRVVNVCTGDLGRGVAKKFDIEAWMPSRTRQTSNVQRSTFNVRGGYFETHSASKLYDFQARRSNIRYRETKIEHRASSIEFCHTLNSTVIASPRILIPILELYQNADGSVTIPKVLRPYMGGKEKIAPRSCLQ